jgi:large subunit ribosomal protein L6
MLVENKMAKIRKLPVEFSKEVKVDLTGRLLKVSGSLGSLELNIHPEVTVDKSDNLLEFYTKSTAKNAKALTGLDRKLAANMIEGVTKGFRKVLELKGVGYKAETDGKLLRLSLGYSHDIVYEVPAGLIVKCTKPTIIEISGFSKHAVGQFAANLRKLRKSDPYKGKGVHFEGEQVRRKEGKNK